MKVWKKRQTVGREACVCEGENEKEKEEMLAKITETERFKRFFILFFVSWHMKARVQHTHERSHNMPSL